MRLRDQFEASEEFQFCDHSSSAAFCIKFYIPLMPTRPPTVTREPLSHCLLQVQNSCRPTVFNMNSNSSRQFIEGPQPGPRLTLHWSQSFGSASSIIYPSSRGHFWSFQASSRTQLTRDLTSSCERFLCDNSRIGELLAIVWIHPSRRP